MLGARIGSPSPTANTKLPAKLTLGWAAGQAPPPASPSPALALLRSAPAHSLSSHWPRRGGSRRLAKCAPRGWPGGSGRGCVRTEPRPQARLPWCARWRRWRRQRRRVAGPAGARRRRRRPQPGPASSCPARPRPARPARRGPLRPGPAPPEGAAPPAERRPGHDRLQIGHRAARPGGREGEWRRAAGAGRVVRSRSQESQACGAGDARSGGGDRGPGPGIRGAWQPSCGAALGGPCAAHRDREEGPAGCAWAAGGARACRSAAGLRAGLALQRWPRLADLSGPQSRASLCFSPLPGPALRVFEAGLPGTCGH